MILNHSRIEEININPTHTKVSFLSNNYTEIEAKVENLKVSFDYKVKALKIISMQDKGYFKAYNIVLKYKFK